MTVFDVFADVYLVIGKLHSGWEARWELMKRRQLASCDVSRVVFKPLSIAVGCFALFFSHLLAFYGRLPCLSRPQRYGGYK
jgi:hypothetical protein